MHPNIVATAKKRRLHEELETLLEAIEQKRVQMSEEEDRSSDINAKKTQKQDELKALERQLTNVLLQQQKKMLQLLSTVIEVKE